MSLDSETDTFCIEEIQHMVDALKTCTRDRELSIVLTKLEESRMWLIKRRDRIECEKMIAENKC